MPLLTAAGLMLKDRSFMTYSTDEAEDYIDVPSNLGHFLFYLGVTGILWHFSWVFGILFIMTSAYAFDRFKKHLKTLNDVNELKDILGVELASSVESKKEHPPSEARS